MNDARIVTQIMRSESPITYAVFAINVVAPHQMSGLSVADRFLHRLQSVADDEILREIATLLAKSRSRAEMTGELLREAALLVMVFAPLDALFNPSVLPWWQIVALAALAAGVGFMGIRIEERR